MANVVYVGNYPNTLSDDDILEIFQDFEGVVLLRTVRDRFKCYSFILCQNQEQVVDIVFSLHDVDVGGRNLIVRASDDDLQYMIEKINLEDEYDEEEDENNCQSYEGSENFNSNSGEFSEGSSASCSTTYRQPQKQGRIASSSLAACATKETSNTIAKDNLLTNRQANPRYLYKTKADIKSNDSEKGFHKFQHNDKSPEKPKINNFDTESCVSYRTSHRSDSLSPCSMTSSRYSSRRPKGEKFSFVSVINFPNGTTAEELQELFSDFNPYKVIIRNPKGDDDQPTEAIICFFKSKHATDAIMNFDNTLYKRRVLLVTECDDTSYISELRNFHLKDK